MTNTGAPDKHRHPQFCDLTQCTAHKAGGAHNSTEMVLGPLPYTHLTVKASLFAMDGMPVPSALVSFHLPLAHPDDIAEAGTDEDILSVILPPDQITQLTTFVGELRDLGTA